MSEKKFVHLHVHSGFSLLDGSGKIKNILERTKELGMDSIALTDHGVMYGCVDFYKQAKKQGIKPILGCEVYVVPKSMHLKQNDSENKTYHLVLLVKNEIGYQNLMKITSAASIEGFYYKPRVDREFLAKHSEGLIALSACLGGEVQRAILNGNLDRAREAALFYKETFKDGFYLELQNHGIEEQRKVNEVNIELSKELDIPLVATNDLHYIYEEDFKAHDILLCIQTGKTIHDEKRMRYGSDQFFIKSPEEMWEMFGHIPEALENTVKIAEMCNYDYEFHVSKLPVYPLPKGENDPYEYLQKICFGGLIERYEILKDFKSGDQYKEIIEFAKTNDDAKLIVDRLLYELGVIKQMGFVDYFLIVWDFTKYAIDNDIPTGPGRGSAAGAIVAYTLGITKIDPIKYSLLFERFLNPERVSMPDIDSDFCYERRQEVIDYVVDKYGEKNVAQIITFGTMAPRACIRDVGRAMNYTYGEVDRIAKMIPTMLGITIDKALELNPELKDAYNTDERVKELIDVARRLEGLPRHSSTHAAGVVIASKPLVEYVPLQKNDESIVTQFDMTTLEELGLLKMDFLGLRTLTVMSDAVKMIKQNRGIDIDLNNIDIDDKSVYQMIGEGKTAGVFQLESAGMTSFMKELKPDTLEDIIAGVSLYRPGPMAEIPRYIEGKRNPENVQYMDKSLENILDVTYGVIVYQEQVMEIVRKLAGYSMGRSDLVRRAMSKKKHDVMEQERKNFIYGVKDENGNVEVEGCLKNGISEGVANKIFDSMMDFASYAFNKSHAAAYAVVGYQTAYLMRYYPVEFIAAMLNSVMGTNEKVSEYIRVAKDLGIDVLPPSINESYSRFTVKGNSIRFGLAAIKNVGVNVVDAIVEAREKSGEFNSLMNFCNKMEVGAVNKRAVESLIKSGAFDEFGVYRSRLISVHERLMDGISAQKKRNIDGQMSLFGALANEENDNLEIKYENVKEFPKKMMLAMEKEMTGLYITGHPLDEYKDSLKNQTSIEINKILEEKRKLDDTTGEMANAEMNLNDGDKVIIGGILSGVSRKVTRNNTIMAFATIEDLSGMMEVIIFPKTLEKCNSLVHDDLMVVIRGRVSFKEDEEAKILCEEVKVLENMNASKLYIRVENVQKAKEINQVLKHVLEEYNGDTPVYIVAAKERQSFRLARECWVDTEKDVVKFLENKFGQDNVKLVD